MFGFDLWYRQPATQWTAALPLGNGRLGAMVFGGAQQEHLQINEESFWTGGPYQPVNPQALAHLDEVRSLIFARRFAEAEALANRHLMAVPHLETSFQPVGDIRISFGHPEVTGYRRGLDLDRAVAEVEYDAAGVRYRRTCFSSAPDGVLVLKVTADRPNALDLFVDLDSPQPGATEAARHNDIGYTGVNREEHGIAGALRFVLRARVMHAGGTLSREGSGIRVTGADSVLLLIDAGTSFRRFDDVSGQPEAAVAARLDAAAALGFDALLARHVTEHRRLYRRLTIDLGSTTAAVLPTDERIARNAAESDPALAALYLQFARYLMISSSRPGTQPATLQGLWNDQLVPPWGSKYTANINLQMNYWLPDPANLGECVEPLLVMAEELAETGSVMARRHYGARGWVMHHNTDLWRATGPVDGAKWGLWPTGGAWLCAELWGHYRYAPDPALLDRLYPIIRGACEFILDILVEEPETGHLVTCPSLSPENVHPHGAAICAGPTMDNQIIRDLFDALVEAATTLNRDAPLVESIAAARARLRPERIGKAGQLQEWGEDWDMEAPEIDHRHVSHLYGLYPSQQISLRATPELAEAAQRSLEIRGDEATGWGIGWRINLWARLRQGNHAHKVLARLLGPDRTYPNLFDAHPPFQIDGNFGGGAGVLEMLVQSNIGEIELLPALPDVWPTGTLSGVRTRGGFELDLVWREGRLERATVKGQGRVRVRWQDREVAVEPKTGSPATVVVSRSGLVIA